MPDGFKIADGYVEVHANYDKNDLRRAAEGAAEGIGDGIESGVEKDRVGRRIANARKTSSADCRPTRAGSGFLADSRRPVRIWSTS